MRENNEIISFHNTQNRINLLNRTKTDRLLLKGKFDRKYKNLQKLNIEKG